MKTRHAARNNGSAERATTMSDAERRMISREVELATLRREVQRGRASLLRGMI